jgi:serine/threonine protein kinase
VAADNPATLLWPLRVVRVTESRKTSEDACYDAAAPRAISRFPVTNASLVGRQIGTYQILALLGRGGMGEVYRATDTKLRRDVAIKVLPSALVRDAARLARFEREAQMLAALNDPHIGAIHGLEEFDGQPALVLELVEGDTLEEMLATRARRQTSAGRSPQSEARSLPLRQALTIARQIAEALEAAHGKGIVHRDLKPANIKIRPDGTVKVLDFGLGKALAEEGSDPDLSATRSGATREGLVLGTVGYMSPEQARGQRVDKRTDIWAFGCVLFELLTATPAFVAETDSDTIAGVLGRDPDWTLIPASTPANIRRLVERCLEKDTRRRLHDMADARIEIEDTLANPSSQSTIVADAASSRRVPSWLPWLIAGASLVVAAGWVFVTERRTSGAPPPLSGVQVQRLTDMVGLEEAPAISPDGKIVAFVAASGTSRQVWIRLLSGGAPLALTKEDVDHYGPRWSPDSSSLIYFTSGSQTGEPGTIWEIPALGGARHRLVDALGPGDLAHDGTRLAYLRFHEGKVELAVANRDGSAIQSATPLGDSSYGAVKWSPDNRKIAISEDPGGARFNSSLLIFDVATRELRRIESPYQFQGLSWLADSSALIVSSSQGSTLSYPPSYNLWRLPIDGSASSQITFGEASYEFPDLGANGQVVASRVKVQSDVWKFPVTGDPADNARRGVRITRQTGLIQTLTVSPDESTVAFLSDNGGHANIWTASVADGEMRSVTRESDPRFVVAVPVWSPRADAITFLSNRNSSTPDVTLWVAKSDGSDVRDLGVKGSWVCWSGDGQWLYFSHVENGVYRLSKMPAAGGAVVRVRDDNAGGCQVSPDGSALYYAKILTQATGAWDYELRRASPEGGESTVIGTVRGARVPTGAYNFHALLSPDGQWLAMPLIDGSTTNLWALSIISGQWRRLTDFGSRNVVIARRIAWSNDSRSIYASVSDVDSDIVKLAGL